MLAAANIANSIPSAGRTFLRQIASTAAEANSTALYQLTSKKSVCCHSISALCIALPWYANATQSARNPFGLIADAATEAAATSHNRFCSAIGSLRSQASAQ